MAMIRGNEHLFPTFKHMSEGIVIKISVPKLSNASVLVQHEHIHTKNKPHAQKSVYYDFFSENI